MRNLSDLERRAKLSRRTEALLASAGQDGPARRWYVLMIDPGADIPVDKALDEASVEHWMATHEDKPKRRGGRKFQNLEPVMKPALPGYIFVRMAWTDEVWHAVSLIDGVGGIVGGAIRPAPLPDKEVHDFRKRADEDPEFIEKLINGLKLGDRVTIDDGPFAAFAGIVTMLDGERCRLKAEVAIFGRAVPVDLDVAQVTKSD